MIKTIAITTPARTTSPMIHAIVLPTAPFSSIAPLLSGTFVVPAPGACVTGAVSRDEPSVLKLGSILSIPSLTESPISGIISDVASPLPMIPSSSVTIPSSVRGIRILFFADAGKIKRDTVRVKRRTERATAAKILPGKRFLLRILLSLAFIKSIFRKILSFVCAAKKRAASLLCTIQKFLSRVFPFGFPIF